MEYTMAHNGGFYSVNIVGVKSIVCVIEYFNNYTK